jgi:hypothetical protein
MARLRCDYFVIQRPLTLGPELGEAKASTASLDYDFGGGGRGPGSLLSITHHLIQNLNPLNSINCQFCPQLDLGIIISEAIAALHIRKIKDRLL